jgi:D-xylose transport system substrate-binding protein
LVAALSNGTEPGALVNGQTSLKGGGQVKSVLLSPIAVDQTNVQQTVLADGFLKKDQLCNGLSSDPTGLCRS